MERRWSWWLSWSLVGASLAFYVPILMLVFVNRDAPQIWQFFELQVAVGALVSSIVGGYLAALRPRNGLGWFFLAAALVWQLSNLLGQYGVYGLETSPGVAGAAFALWLSLWLSAVMLITFPTVPLLLFPSGRLPGRLPKIIATGVALAVTLLVGGLLVSPTYPPGFPDLYAQTPHPFSTSAAPWNPVLGIMLGALCGLGAIVILLRRFYLARGVVRQQYKWVILIMALLLVAYIADFVVRSTASDYAAITNLAMSVLIMLLPVAMAVAIFRHRLWDIDIIISRALVYGALSICVVAIYVIAVGWLGTVFRTGGNLAFSLVATGVVAILFQPLRERIQRGVNRLLYGERDEPYAVISRLGRRLEDTFVPDAVLAAIVGTVSEALRLPYAAIATGSRGNWAVAAAVGDPVADPVRLPLMYQQAPVGELLVGRRSPGEEFSASDNQLLDDLARQAGIAVHSVTLARELQQARERLVTLREEERRRLRRDLHDGLGSQLAALHLHAGALRHLIDAEPERAQQELDDLRAELREAIASIRELVHGLRPVAIDELGLLTALEERVLRMDSSDLSVRVDFPDELPPLAAAVEVAIYRIVEEALANVVRHSHASHCRVAIHVNDVVNVLIEDDGVGFKQGTLLGVGQFSMRERAEELGGRCTIESSPGSGTRVDVGIPLGNRSVHE